MSKRASSSAYSALSCAISEDPDPQAAERLQAVIDAARSFLVAVDRAASREPRALIEELAVLEQAMAELFAPTCAACGLPILGREGLRTGRDEEGWRHYHRTCCRDGQERLNADRRAPKSGMPAWMLGEKPR